MLWSLLSLLLALVASASFTPASNDFPAYEGDREVLTQLSWLFKSCDLEPPQDAKCLDDILTDKMLLHLVHSLSRMPQSLTALGRLLTELSPKRFDSFCNLLDESNANMEPLVQGYGNAESVWKRALSMPPNSPLNYENAPYHRAMSAEHCALLEDRAHAILFKTVFIRCCQIWTADGRNDLIRAATRTRLCLPRGVLVAFNGHDGEFVEWFKHALQSDVKITPMSVLPAQFHMPFALGLNFWREIRDFIHANLTIINVPHITLTYQPVSAETAQIVAEINAMSFSTRECAYHGIDREPFEGELPVSRRLLRRQHADYHLQRSTLPNSLKYAYGYAHVNLKRLENSLQVLSLFCPPDAAKELVTTSFWEWLANFLIFAGMRPQLHRIRAIFAVSKEYLVRLPDAAHQAKIEGHWGLLPLLQEMIQDPTQFFPASLAEEGLKWARSLINGIPTDEASAMSSYGRKKNMSLIALAFDQGWREAAQLAFNTHEGWNEKDIYFGHEALSIFLRFFPPQSLLEKRGVVLGENLRGCLFWIAQTANQKLLDCYAELYQPTYLVHLCGHDPALRRRIQLMLHLSHKVVSFKPDGKEVKKNSIFFRNWVMLRLFTKHTADLKLLYYYFHNRLTGNYPHYDLISGDRIWGLVGQHDRGTSGWRARDLLFKEEVGNVVIGYYTPGASFADLEGNAFLGLFEIDYAITAEERQLVDSWFN